MIHLFTCIYHKYIEVGACNFKKPTRSHGDLYFGLPGLAQTFGFASIVSQCHIKKMKKALKNPAHDLHERWDVGNMVK